MNTWDDLLKNQTALTKEEVYIIDSLSSLVVQRIKHGITQAELAKQMGMSQSQLARLENLDYFPEITMLYKYTAGLAAQIENNKKIWKNIFLGDPRLHTGIKKNVNSFFDLCYFQIPFFFFMLSEVQRGKKCPMEKFFCAILLSLCFYRYNDRYIFPTNFDSFNSFGARRLRRVFFCTF